MTYSDDSDDMRRLLRQEEKKAIWKEYAKGKKELRKGMLIARLNAYKMRKHTPIDDTPTMHNLGLKMRYDLDKYFQNGFYDRTMNNKFMLRNAIFYLGIWLGVALLMGIGSNEL